MPQVDSNEKIYTKKYSVKWETSLQQSVSLFRGKTVVDTGANGSMYRVPIIGSREMSEVLSEDDDTPNNEQSTDVRWMTPKGFEDGILLPKNLSLYSENGEGYASRVLAEMGKAAKKKMDDVILAGAVAPVRTGIDGGEFLDFPVGNVVASKFSLDSPSNTTALSMTYDKVLRAKTLLMEAEAANDGDKLIFAISPRALEGMLKDPHFTSSDYTDIRALISGKITQFLGFEWVVTNRLSVVGGERQCLCWNEKAITLGLWKDYKVECSPRADKKNRDQLYVYMNCSAARMKDDGVYKVFCKEV